MDKPTEVVYKSEDGKYTTVYHTINGRREGSIKFYNGDQTRLYWKGSYTRDREEGEWIHYYDDGTVALRQTFHEGRKVGKEHEYYPNGFLAKITEYADWNKRKREIHYSSKKSGEITMIIKFDKDGNFYDAI